MKILVAVKRVIDFNVKIRVNPEKTGVETSHVKMAMNPFDEIALEEALRLREAGYAQEVVAVSIGTQASQETLRAALALGADRGILIQTERILESLHIASVLAQLAAEEKPDLIFLGKQAIDTDNSQTGPMLAGLLDWPQGCFVSKVEIQDDFVLITSEVDGGLKQLRLKRPAVITVDLRLNQPRYATLPNIMKANKKPLTTVDLETLGLDLSPHTQTLRVEPPPLRKPGVYVNSVEELLQKLQHEAKVL